MKILPKARPRAIHIVSVVILLTAASAWTPSALAADPTGKDTAPEAGASASILEQILAIEHDGDSRPREAAQALEQLLPSTAPFSRERLELLTVRGLLLTRASDTEAADKVALLLDGWSGTPASGAAAAASLVRARGHSLRGDLKKADALMTDALARLPADARPVTRLRYLWIQARVKDDSGQLENAIRIYHEALKLADHLGDAWRSAEIRSSLAYTCLEAKQIERAKSLNAEALQIAQAAQDHTALGRAHNTAGVILDDIGDREGQQREMQWAVDSARRSGSKGDEALYLANLGDFYLKRGQYNTALTVSQQALSLLREMHDIGREAVALANVGLAHISLKNIAVGKRFVDEAIAINERRGSITGASLTLIDLGIYLEKAGDLAGAVNAYHRHRLFADDILKRGQQKAILEMQERFDAERRSRDLALLNGENQLKNERLRRQDLQQRLWWLLAATFLLSFIVLLMLYRRIRKSNRALESSNHQLLVQSERDPLTGLANRRHFQAAMKKLAADGKLAGTVFMMDIDHFKRINDMHGHAAGDTVLKVVATRLRETLRDQDLIVRWGGEEFLVIVRALAPEQSEALAKRMLVEIGGTPVEHEGKPIPVTGSIGFATFPIDPTLLAVSWERAICLVDSAMYLAKTHGRNRAHGIRLLHARDEAKLDDITRSLEGAWHEGRVALTLLQGPVMPDSAMPDAATVAGEAMA